ncbi:MAG: DUF3341 domain-containing protein [Phycisphaerales bacterium]
MATSVFCIAKDRVMADTIVSRLQASGFSNNDISVLFPDNSSTRSFAHEKNTKAPEGATAGAGAGGVLGGAVGLLAGMGMLAIPGVGPLIAAGPIMAALSGIAVGAAVGGVAGALIGMGVPEYEAKRYENMVKDGNILISAHAGNSEEAKTARKIFEDVGAADIASSGESKAPENSENRDKPDIRTMPSQYNAGSRAP